MLKFLVAAFLGGLLAVGLTKATETAPANLSATPQQSAFDRVIITRTLRCSYAAFDPFLIIGDGQKITGIFHDVVEEAGKRLGIKIVWSEEVSYGNINTGFMTGRYDAFCAGLWPAGTRSSNTIFSLPIAWEPIGVWVRGDDNRFNEHIETLNDPAYRISDIEGDATAAMVDALFPKARHIFVVQGQDVAQEILEVTTNKADAMFGDYIDVDKHLKNAPGSLKNLSPEKPALIYPVTIGFNQKEHALKSMFDVVIDDMQRDGTIHGIIKTYLGDKSNMLFQEQHQFTPY